MAATPEQIHAAAQAGDRMAQIALSRLFDQQGRHDIALAWLKQAAEGGEAVASTLLGARLLVGRAAPFQPEDGAAWIYHGAEQGGAEAAARAAVLNALGIGRPADWTAAMDWLAQAAERGEASARGQMAVLSGDAKLAKRIMDGEALSAADWKQARVAIDIDAWLTPPEAEVISDDPRIRVYRAFAPPAARDWLIRRAETRLEALKVYDPADGGSRNDAIRTSRGAGFGLLDTDLVLTVMRARMGRATELDTARFEPANILNYQVGQSYKPHYDFINPDVPAFAENLARQGQRTATVLTYLNGDYEGGETDFPELDWAFKAEAGDALAFFSVDEAGAPIPRSLHAGLPPTAGQKWLLSQWIRDRPQPIV